MLKHLNLIWFAVVGVAVLVFFLNPELLDRETVAAFIDRFGTEAFVVYVLICLTRSLLLIPSTPFIFAGALAFPDWPLAVLAASMAGVLSGSLLIYSFPGIGGYDERLKARYPKQIAYIRERMQGAGAWWVTMGWSAFPFVPTDLICYVAGLAKMPPAKMAAAVQIGSFPLMAVYVYTGAELGAILLN
ncbi:MAG: VTT domain-containing protein [Gammaproteobacteria bacterium]|nr:VTT domain-containing protein [Gammaproteobacteria bacterium]